MFDMYAGAGGGDQKKTLSAEKWVLQRTGKINIDPSAQTQHF